MIGYLVLYKILWRKKYLFYESTLEKASVRLQVHELFLTYTAEKHTRRYYGKELCYSVELVSWSGLLILKAYELIPGEFNSLLE